MDGGVAMDGTASVAKAAGTGARAFMADTAFEGMKAATDSTASRVAEDFMAAVASIGKAASTVEAAPTVAADSTVAAGPTAVEALTAEAGVGNE